MYQELSAAFRKYHPSVHPCLPENDLEATAALGGSLQQKRDGDEEGRRDGEWDRVVIGADISGTEGLGRGAPVKDVERGCEGGDGDRPGTGVDSLMEYEDDMSVSLYQTTVVDPSRAK